MRTILMRKTFGSLKMMQKKDEQMSKMKRVRLVFPKSISLLNYCLNYFYSLSKYQFRNDNFSTFHSKMDIMCNKQTTVKWHIQPLVHEYVICHLQIRTWCPLQNSIVCCNIPMMFFWGYHDLIWVHTISLNSWSTVQGQICNLPVKPIPNPIARLFPLLPVKQKKQIGTELCQTEVLIKLQFIICYS